MDQDERRINTNSYFLSQFNYSPIIWMNYKKSVKKKISNLYETALGLIYCYHSSNLQVRLIYCYHSTTSKRQLCDNISKKISTL